MPAHIHHGAQARIVFGQNRGIVFHRDSVHQCGTVPGGPHRPAEQIIHQVDAMAGDIVQRPAAGLRRVEQPIPRGARRVEPIVSRGLGKNRTPDGSRRQQFARPLHLRIHAPVIGNAQRSSGFFGGLLDGHGLLVVHRHRLLAQHVPAGAQRGDGLRGVDKNRCGDVDRFGRAGRQGCLQALPTGDAIRRGLSRVARHDSRQPAVRRGQNRRQNPLGRNIADPHYQPGERHTLHHTRWFPVRSIRSGASNVFQLEADARWLAGVCATQNQESVEEWDRRLRLPSAAAIEPSSRPALCHRQGRVRGQAESGTYDLSKAIHPHFGFWPGGRLYYLWREGTAVVIQQGVIGIVYRLRVLPNVAFGIEATRQLLKFAALDCFQITHTDLGCSRNLE